jgi:hypothetical protein
LTGSLVLLSAPARGNGQVFNGELRKENMNRKLKALGLTVVALMAAMALSVSAASAAEFHSEVAHTSLSGSQIGTDVFTVNAGTVKCTEATYTGTQSAETAKTVKVLPKYSGCTAFSFVNTTIDVNGCEYEFSGENTDVNIVNCATPITVTAFNCWVTVGAQSGLKSVTYTNEGSGTSRDVKVKVAITGIKYTQHSKSFPGCSSGTFTNGSYTGEATVKGANTAGEQVGIWRI